MLNLLSNQLFHTFQYNKLQNQYYNICILLIFQKYFKILNLILNLFQMFGISGGSNMRGLNEFISDIRACKDKQSQSKRVEDQLAKIRQRFTTEKGLNAYQRKKYVWKLLYIHILGYEVDFGFYQASNLINSSKYDQKYTGYIASSLLVTQSNEEIWRSIVHSIQADIRSRNQSAQSLALSLIASIVPDILVNALSDTIIQLAISNKASINVRKKAIMCLARIVKKNPNNYDVKKFIAPIGDMLDGKKGSLSFQNAAVSFLLVLMNHSNPDVLIQVQPKVVRLLHKLALFKLGGSDVSANYVYFSHANPWMQMKLYKALQLWSAPTRDSGVLSMIEQVLSKVLKKIETSKSINKNNTEYGLLFQVINLIIHLDKNVNPKLIQDVSKILVVFIVSSQANIRYLGLQAMCRLAIKHSMSPHLQKILPNLDDKDISIRRRALDLLYLICNHENVSIIVAELLGYLESRNDVLIRDDLVLKIAILAEMFAENLIWYVDVVVKLIQNAEVENDIWYRIIQIITGFGAANKQLQNYAALKLFQTLSVPHITETSKCVGSYVVAEFSEYLVKAGKTPTKIYEVINKHFQTANNKSKAMMLNAFAKLAVKYDELKSEVQMICHMCSQHWDPDVQQRGIEFIAIFDEDEETQKKILTQNPIFTESQQQSNPLLKKFAKKSKRQVESSTIKTVGKSTIKSFESVPTRETNVSTSHPLSTHPCFKKAIDKLSPTLLNLLDIPGKFQLKPYWKQALVKKTPFQDCQLKQKMQEGVLKVILIANIQTAQMQFKIFRSKGFQITNSPIKYSTQSQQIMLTIVPTGEKIEPPTVAIAWKNAENKIVKKQLQLPIAISKFLNPVELEYEKFNTFYKDYSLQNQKFFKLDSFVKVPEGVRPQDYLKKIGSFLSSVCNFKCGAFPSFDNIDVIYGSATFHLKVDGKLVKYPILIEVQAYEQDKTRATRVSLRGGHGNSILSVYQTFLAFFSE